VRAGGRSDLKYHFYIVNTDMVNAFALPGGYVFVTRGLMNFIENDDELAAVLGHELAHVARRHSVVEYKKSMKAMLANFLILLLTRDPNLVIASEMYQQGRTEMWGRHAEIEADTYGTEYVVSAGYDPSALMNFFNKLDRLEQHSPPIFEGYFDVHPPTKDRIRIVKDYLKKMNISVAPVEENPVRARVFASEDCKDADGRCDGVVMSSSLELMRLTDPGKNRSAYERSQEIALVLNSMLDAGVRIYDVKVVASDEGPGLWIKETLLVRVLPGDAEASGMLASSLAAAWEQKLKNFIWSENIKDD
jgi:hypothetical protein